MKGNQEYQIQPDEAYIRDALRDGQAKRIAISMKDLGAPDVSLQARVLNLHSVHVERLRESLRDSGSLRPVVVFRQEGGRLLWLADGFHRHEAYRLEKIATIPCYLVEGGFREALKFATMCNRDNCLKRTIEDERRAAFMLFANPEWWIKSGRIIGDHIGVSPSVVDKWRTEYSVENDVDPPDEIVAKNGKRYSRARSRKGVPKPDNRGRYRRCVGGKMVELGKNLKEATKRSQEIDKELKITPTLSKQCPTCRGSGVIIDRMKIA